MKGGLISQLDNSPVAGVAMGNVSLLRLDRSGGLAPGNKHFKLLGNIAAATRSGVRRLVSFGGAWSNHIHALAAIGREQGFATVGIIRGDDDSPESAMLADARDWGMEIIKVSREEYRRRNDEAYIELVRARFAPCLVIPEGGANSDGVLGCQAIAELVRGLAPGAGKIVLPVGTGTTLAGLVAGLGANADETLVVGISALKGAKDLEDRVQGALLACARGPAARWRILHDHHCGGFARVSDPLRQFMLEFERVQGIALDPVYTGKMLFAIHQLLRRGDWDAGLPILAIHTGGLQGRRGYSWLSADA